ncbi:heme ABC exporter ATP-binding protein CcmA [Alisedimentitalea sp. MJ-SS2]|uniref:heme ABC exporter ATP-binding protein CcmA n=1 Tax=Aliisedimentitalea sp. MJ-SS2 TaxID=3049795 RepID=UPI00290A3693|nr:heme ABC exporter ATP-binding protein CcmA [Alisedimentitalea sp. MJ-SS2]MDU8926410.1 heme ABC exporter ATP-binding protein CcmA [Alisedimentitalea sp. MJ-SS2]
MVLEVTDLAVARGGIPVLEGLSFRLEPGRALILRGPNGIGKTTLLRTIAGLQPALKGTIGLDREAMAYAAHADGIKSTLSVEENLAFWASVFGTGSISGALNGFALNELKRRPAGALSAGQKRRLGLARLLVTGRPVWVLDEPTVSLDVEAVAMFGAAIRAHLADGGMALIATHIDLGLDEAEVFDVGPFKAKAPAPENFDEVFL